MIVTYRMYLVLRVSMTSVRSFMGSIFAGASPEPSSLIVLGASSRLSFLSSVWAPSHSRLNVNEAIFLKRD